MRRRASGSVLLGLLLLGLAHGEATARPSSLKLLTMQGGDGAMSLLFYKSECDADAAADCAVASFECDGSRHLTLVLPGFDDAALGNWLIAAKASAQLSAGSSFVEFRTSAVNFNESTGSWDATLFGVLKAGGPSVADVMAADKPATIKVTGRSFVLPAGGKDAEDVAAFFRRCPQSRP